MQQIIQRVLRAVAVSFIIRGIKRLFSKKK